MMTPSLADVAFIDGDITIAKHSNTLSRTGDAATARASLTSPCTIPVAQ